MECAGKKRLGRGDFDDAPCVHDRDTIGKSANDSQIVGYEQIGKTVDALEIL